MCSAVELSPATIASLACSTIRSWAVEGFRRRTRARFLRQGSGESVDFLSVLDGHHGGDRLHEELRRNIRVRIDVDLGELDLSFVGVRHGFEDR